MSAQAYPTLFYCFIIEMLQFINVQAICIYFIVVSIKHKNDYIVLLCLHSNKSLIDMQGRYPSWSLYSAKLLKRSLLKQDYDATKWKSSLPKFNSCHYGFMGRYGVSICTIRTSLFIAVSLLFLPLPSTLDFTFYVYEQFGESFLKSRKHVSILLVHLVLAPSYKWIPSWSFSLDSTWYLVVSFSLLCVSIFSV